MSEPDCCASPPLVDPVEESLPERSKEAPSPPVKPPFSASSEVGPLSTSPSCEVCCVKSSGSLPNRSEYLSTTVPAATASASATSVLADCAVTATPPEELVTFRSNRASALSNATPTATDAPTAVLSAETSPLAVDRVLVCVDADMVILSDADKAEPEPIFASTSFNSTPTDTAASRDVFASPPASSGLAPAKAFVSISDSAEAMTPTDAAVPESTALSSMIALVFSATIMLTEIPAPIPVPPPSPPSPSPPSPSPPSPSPPSPPPPSPPPSLSELLSSLPKLACKLSSMPSKPFSAASVQTFKSVNVEKVSSMPSHIVLVMPTVALASVLYLFLDAALTRISPDAFTVEPEVTMAELLLRTTTFNPTEPARENSPVPAPATASAVMTFVSSVELSSCSCSNIPA